MKTKISLWTCVFLILSVFPINAMALTITYFNDTFTGTDGTNITGRVPIFPTNTSWYQTGSRQKATIQSDVLAFNNPGDFDQTKVWIDLGNQTLIGNLTIQFIFSTWSPLDARTQFQFYNTSVTTSNESSSGRVLFDANVLSKDFGFFSMGIGQGETAGTMVCSNGSGNNAFQSQGINHTYKLNLTHSNLTEKYTAQVYIWNSTGNFADYNLRLTCNTIVNLTQIRMMSFDQNRDSFLDNITIIGEVITPPTPDITPPAVIQPINLTSADPDDITSPYISQGDTTPTFWILTDENSSCAIANFSANYTTMGSSRNCSSGDNSRYHICTLNPSDELPIFTGNVCLYAACKDTAGNENTSATSGCILTGTGYGSEAEGDVAIERGINSSLTLTQRTIYTDQQVYIRTLNNNQQLGTFDKFVISGLKRWAFNYVTTGQTFTGMLNLSPSFYVLEMTNMTETQITDAVGDLINATKT